MRFVNWIYGHNNRKYLVISFAILVLGIILINTRYFGLVTLPNEKFVDLYFFYNEAVFYDILHSLNDIEILGYKLVHLADYVFAIGLYPFIAIILSKIVDIDSRFRVIVFLPFIGGLFDILENITMDIHLYSFPAEYLTLGGLSWFFTLMKFGFFYFSIILVIVLPMIKFFKNRFVNQ